MKPDGKSKFKVRVLGTLFLKKILKTTLPIFFFGKSTNTVKGMGTTLAKEYECKTKSNRGEIRRSMYSTRIDFINTMAKYGLKIQK